MDLDLPGSGKTVEQVYSVFDYDTGAFTYYVAPTPAPPLTGHYRAPRSVLPEGLAVPLPSNARKTGTGTEARGIVASIGSVDVTASPFPWGKALMIGGLFAGAIYFSRRKRR